LGSTLEALGEYTEAKKCLERALAIQEMTYDENHPTLAMTLSNLGQYEEP
jgi:tetratricopeptide (TPR) repeat protein